MAAASAVCRALRHVWLVASRAPAAASSEQAAMQSRNAGGRWPSSLPWSTGRRYLRVWGRQIIRAGVRMPRLNMAMDSLRTERGVGDSMKAFYVIIVLTSWQGHTERHV